VYKGRLIAYSLGTLISDFRQMDVRLSALLHLELTRTRDDQVVVSDFWFSPTLVETGTHKILSLSGSSGPGNDSRGEHLQAYKLASKVLGDALDDARE
jgi:hypothetical protein